MTKKSASSDEYELMPIKPLHDLKKEVRQLRTELQKEDKMHEVMVKILNSNIQTQRQVMETMHKLEEVKNSLHKFTKLLSELNDEVDEQPDDSFNKIITKLNNIETNHKEVVKSLNKITEANNKKEYFKLNMPRKVPLVYRRTK